MKAKITMGFIRKEGKEYHISFSKNKDIKLTPNGTYIQKEYVSAYFKTKKEATKFYKLMESLNK